MSYRFADSFRGSCQQTCMTYTTAVCTVKSHDDEQKNCPKHVEFYSKNNFEKLVHPVAFIIIIYHDAQSPERQIQNTQFTFNKFSSENHSLYEIIKTSFLSTTAVVKRTHHNVTLFVHFLSCFLS